MTSKLATAIIFIVILGSTGMTIALGGLSAGSNTGSPNDFKPSYDYFDGVGVFDRGIHIIATSQNPLDLSGDFWNYLKNNETTRPNKEDFVSLVIARGDFPTGGYMIQIKSFSWLESCPVKLRFAANFTNPGEGVMVTQLLTNPLVLITLGRLDPGAYKVEVHIDTYILTYDSEGKAVYTQLQTFKEEIWSQSFVVE